MEDPKYPKEKKIENNIMNREVIKTMEGINNPFFSKLNILLFFFFLTALLEQNKVLIKLQEAGFEWQKKVINISKKKKNQSKRIKNIFFTN